MALEANGYVGVEAVGGDMFDEYIQSVIAYKVRMQRMSNDRWTKHIDM